MKCLKKLLWYSTLNSFIDFASYELHYFQWLAVRVWLQTEQEKKNYISRKSRTKWVSLHKQILTNYS